ncbi:site-specific integrase [Burkholderia cenocepacia]|uniref:site-specific integrase n=1 Tax=Burkholderia cenocepacia TaxID=95486 RepID=UPI001CF1EC8A|nr:site-specific integrase [Burkholderia cenocepacia]MCA8005142.1 site-specific integrase [Burkholderia cenocepacia]
MSLLAHEKWYTEDSENLKNKPGLVARNGTYYARVRVPTLLVGLLQKHEIKISLRTKNLNEARAKLPAALVEIHKQLAAAAKVADAVAAPADEVRRSTLEQIARTWFEPRWRATSEALWKPTPAGMTAEDALCNSDPELARLTPPDEVTFGEYLHQARGLLVAAGYAKPSGSSVEVLAQFMVRGEIECLNRSRRFLVDGRLYDAIEDPLYRPIGGSGERVARADAATVPKGITIDEAIKRFENDPQRAKLSRKNLDGYQHSFRLLREIVGGNMPLSAVNRDHAREVQEVFAHLPANATKRFSGMTLVEAAEHAKKSGIPPISAKTAQVQLGNFSSFFSWAVREHLVDKTPAAGLQPLQEKRSKDEGRQPFSDADLVKLFSADLFREPYNRVAPRLLGRYWVPLLALYHGARLNELCQLEVSDAGVADGIPFLHFREESAADEEKHLKTRNSERVIPIHPVLQQLRFVEYVEATRKAGHARLFPSLTKSATGYYSDNFSKWFGRFCDKCGVTDSRLAFHSFRHGFRDAARAADIPREIAQALGGWSDGDDSTSEDYGKGYTLSRKAAELAKIRFPAVEKILPLQGVNEKRHDG